MPKLWSLTEKGLDVGFLKSEKGGVLINFVVSKVSLEVKIPIWVQEEICNNLGLFQRQVVDPREQDTKGLMVAHLLIRNVILEPSPKECVMWVKQDVDE